MSDFIAQTTGDIKEAIERTREAEAYRREMLEKRFSGDKEYVARYMKMKERRARG